ncbi:MAG: DivIVA domain-containing protein [Actinomycetota bacterium]
MSSTELDLPILVTPEQIRRREFVTTRRGYDVEQVRDYLEQLSHQVEQMETMLRTAKLQADAAERARSGPRLDPYQQLSDRFAEVLRTTDREADRIRREAKEEADRVLREARTEADRIRLDAQSRAEQAREEAERAVREARSHADRTISGLATRRDALVEQLAAMQERLIDVAHELEAAIERPEDEAALLASLEAAAADASIGDPTTETAEPDADAVAELEATFAPDEPAEPAEPEQHPAPPAQQQTPPVDTTATVIDIGQPERTVEELWASADPDDLRIPEIPALELDWDDDQQD